MTLDDLVKVYNDTVVGLLAFGDEKITVGEAKRIGIRAVVEALAPDDDEIAAYNRLSYKVREQLKCECDYLPEDRCIRCSVMEALKCLETRFDDILSDAGNEKAAGGPHDDGVLIGNQNVEAIINDLHDEQKNKAAADPSPSEVCEWRANEYEGAYTPGCDTPAVWYSDGSETPQKEGYNFCPSCGKPIVFKESTP